MCEPTRAAVTEYCRPVGGLDNSTVFSHSSRGQKSAIKVSIGLVFSVLGLRMAPYPRVFTWWPLGPCVLVF